MFAEVRIRFRYQLVCGCSSMYQPSLPTDLKHYSTPALACLKTACRGGSIKVVP